MSEIEDHKENILPLKSGRRADALVDSYAKSETQLEKTRKQKEAVLARASEEADDPLEPYVSCKEAAALPVCIATWLGRVC